MRTSKKVLAMALALAMIMSLCAFAADVNDYTDLDDINPELLPSIELLGALGVMEGHDDGSFEPDGTVTRGQAAKMLYVLLTKSTDASGWLNLNAFTDTKGHWAEGYIAYCASVGIVSGVSGTPYVDAKYNPNGSVTAGELAKMLLCAAGYNAEKEGFVGANWLQKVLGAATTAGLLDGYVGLYSAPAPRQWAALLMTNLLGNVYTVTYPNGERTEGAQTYGQRNFNLTTTMVRLTATRDIVINLSAADGNPGYTHNNATGKNIYSTGAGTGISVVGNANYTGDVLINYDVSDALIGQMVNVLSRGPLNTNGSTKIYGVYVADNAIRTTLDAFYQVDTNTYSIGGANHTITDSAVMKLYNTYTGIMDADTTDQVVATYFGTPILSNVPITVFDADGNGTYDSVIVYDSAFASVATFNATNIFTTNDATVGTDANVATATAYAGYSFGAGIAVDDIVKMTADYSAAGKIIKVEKVTPVTGKITAIAANDVISLAGTAYRNATVVLSTPPDLTDITTLGAAALGVEYNFYTDGKYVLAATATTQVVGAFSPNFCYVIDSEVGTFGDARVQILNAVTNKVEIYDYVNGTGYESITATHDGQDKVYQYVIADGKISFLTGPQAPASAKLQMNQNAASAVTLAFTKATGTVTVKPAAAYDAGAGAGNPVSVRTTADTYFFVKYATGTKVALLKASEITTDVLAQVATGGGFLSYAFLPIGGLNTLVFGVLDLNAAPNTNAITTSTSSAVYAYITAGTTLQIVDEETVTVIPVVTAASPAGVNLIAADTVHAGGVATAGKLVKTTNVNGVDTVANWLWASDAGAAAASLANLITDQGKWFGGEIKSVGTGVNAGTMVIKAYYNSGSSWTAGAFDDFLTLAAGANVWKVDMTTGAIVANATPIVASASSAMNCLFRVNASGQITDLFFSADGSAIATIMTLS